MRSNVIMCNDLKQSHIAISFEITINTKRGWLAMLTYATFVTGLQKPIAQWAEEEGHRIRQTLDGAVIYDTKNSNRALPCFFNTFTVLDTEKRSGPKAVDQLMQKVLQRQFSNIPDVKKGRGSFRIVTSRENQLIAVDNRLRNDVEKLISSKTGLVPDRRGGGREFWFLARSEGITLFMERQPSPKEPSLKKGELRPQLAYCLNRLADPAPEDIMIDPFCGYGAITKARAAYFPCQAIHGLDIDGQKIKTLQQMKAFTKKRPTPPRVQPVTKCNRLNYQRGDIRQLSSIFPAKSVDVIVTDPPWGLYGDNEKDDISSLYKTMAEECSKVIKPGGRIVILTAQKELLRAHINNGFWRNIGNRQTENLQMENTQVGNTQMSNSQTRNSQTENTQARNTQTRNSQAGTCYEIDTCYNSSDTYYIIDACYDILVSGQKAAIFVIKASAN